MAIYSWTNNPEENRVQREEAQAVHYDQIKGYQEELVVVQRISPTAEGCWINDSIGHYLSAEIILTAAAYGWKDEAAINAAERYWGSDPDDENLPEYVYDAADEAIAWMNENVAPEGYAFDYQDGGFYMMPLEWFGEEDSFEPGWIVD